MINDNLKMVGKLSIAINDTIVQEIDNLVVTSGKVWVAQRMNNVNTVMTHQAIGTGTATAVVANTSLATELVRVALTSTTVTANTIVYVATYAAGTGTGAVTEAGMFDASSAGDMLCRTVFSVINKGADDSMTITWSVTVS
jgi:hypothetical protein|tara:strand:- start:277 stop:699 length:423 start_codon:yes stop_codon:yes gene_type:complete